MLVLTGMERQMTADFKDALTAKAPELEIAVGSVEDTPERVEFMLSWAPRAEEISRYPNLRFICSGGAGVDGILRVPDLPSDLPIVRLVDKILTQRMTHYVVHAVLHHYRRTNHYVAAQARADWAPTEPHGIETSRVGILGLGALGSDAAEKLLALEFSVAGWTRRPKTHRGVTCHHGRDGLGAFLAGSADEIFDSPKTDYTRALMAAAFDLEVAHGGEVRT